MRSAKLICNESVVYILHFTPCFRTFDHRLLFERRLGIGMIVNSESRLVCISLMIELKYIFVRQLWHSSFRTCALAWARGSPPKPCMTSCSMALFVRHCPSMTSLPKDASSQGLAKTSMSWTIFSPSKSPTPFGVHLRSVTSYLGKCGIIRTKVYIVSLFFSGVGNTYSYQLQYANFHDCHSTHSHYLLLYSGTSKSKLIESKTKLCRPYLQWNKVMRCTIHHVTPYNTETIFFLVWTNLLGEFVSRD